MQDYLKSQGFVRGKGLNYQTAIGIRADEMDRVSPRYQEDKIVYPLIDGGITKVDVHNFWARHDWRLSLPEHLGNCTWCWKKSDRKLFTLAVDSPEVFDFPRRMEALYGDVRSQDKPRRFFRGERTADDIIRQASVGAFMKAGQVSLWSDELDIGGCGESCEVGTDAIPFDGSE